MQILKKYFLGKYPLFLVLVVGLCILFVSEQYYITPLSSITTDISRTNESYVEELVVEKQVQEEKVENFTVVINTGEKNYQRALHLQGLLLENLDPKYLYFLSDVYLNLSNIVWTSSVSEGWQGAQKRFLSIFHLKKLKNITTPWIFLIDDDCFPIISNLRDILKELDPSKPYFYGQLCGYENWKSGEIPRHCGGAGLLVSSQIIDKVPSCEREGDAAYEIQMSKCFAQAKITLYPLEGFCSQAPSFYGQTESFSYPISFHYLTEKDKENLSESEKKALQKGQKFSQPLLCFQKCKHLNHIDDLNFAPFFE
jgi:hypothetical protein